MKSNALRKYKNLYSIIVRCWRFLVIAVIRSRGNFFFKCEAGDTEVNAPRPRLMASSWSQAKYSATTPKICELLTADEKISLKTCSCCIWHAVAMPLWIAAFLILWEMSIGCSRRNITPALLLKKLNTKALLQRRTSARNSLWLRPILEIFLDTLWAGEVIFSSTSAKSLSPLGEKKRILWNHRKGNLNGAIWRTEACHVMAKPWKLVTVNKFAHFFMELFSTEAFHNLSVMYDSSSALLRGCLSRLLLHTPTYATCATFSFRRDPCSLSTTWFLLIASLCVRFRQCAFAYADVRLFASVCIAARVRVSARPYVCVYVCA